MVFGSAQAVKGRLPYGPSRAELTMDTHDRYQWTVEIVPIEKAEGALNRTTIGTYEVYGIHIVDHQAEGETAPSKKAMIIARQHDDVRRYTDFTRSAGTNATYKGEAPYAGMYSLKCGHGKGTRFAQGEELTSCAHCRKREYSLLKPA